MNSKLLRSARLKESNTSIQLRCIKLITFIKLQKIYIFKKKILFIKDASQLTQKY